ncbi:bacterioferritin [Agaribacterium sp. ZY112]|uniref:bacterioferritin n=1 Tax=Agaribacterium sp. ZY112 TaxID=3233574 RepID=UPI0035260CDB
MKGNDKIIAELNRLLSYELAAMDQYFLHSEMYADWGFSKLAARIGHEFDDEKGHAQKLIARILFLEGKPDMVTRHDINIGEDVPAMLQSDLDVEYAVDAALKEVIALCESEKDYVTRDMLSVLLEDTEVDHAWWLEQQLGLIKRVGLENYLQSQM